MTKKRNILYKLAAALTAICMLTAFSGCGEDADAKSGKVEDGVTQKDETNAADQKKLQVVATIFPEYDWVKEILGAQADQVDLTLLLGNGVDMHSYQPTMADILKISTCDVFIYVGGESDSWVADVLKGAGNPDRKAINLMEVLGDEAKEEEIVEGMQDEDGHVHESETKTDAQEDSESSQDADTQDAIAGTDRNEESAGNAADTEDSHKHDDDLEYDEHVWLSLKNTALFCDAITDALAEADPEHAKTYQDNAAAYEEKLAALDQEYEETVDASEQKTLLFADRFPFRYLTDDYGITYYAAFTGCSAETDASFETITFLAGKLDELKLPVVLTIENSDQKVAKAVIENTKTKDQKILTLDSMQSVTSDEIADGTTYLSIMESNLKILKEAL